MNWLIAICCAKVGLFRGLAGDTAVIFGSHGPFSFDFQEELVIYSMRIWDSLSDSSQAAFFRHNETLKSGPNPSLVI